MAGHVDTPLTDHGREQARRAGAYLRDVLELSPDVVYASTLSRAYETAEIVAQELGIDDVVGDDRLQERHVGRIGGMLKPLPADRREQVESDQSVMGRFQSAIDDIYKKYPQSTVLVAAHGGNIKHWINHICDTARGRCHNTGLSCVDYDGESGRCVFYDLCDWVE